MKRITWLTLYLLGMGLLTGCPSSRKPPVVLVTPTATPIVTPTPIASVTPTPTPTPIPIPSPEPSITPLFSVPSGIPVGTAIPNPPNIYTTPSPVPILSTPAPIKPKPTPAAIEQLNIPTNPAQKITPNGIGAAKIGMTFEELKQQLGNGYDFQVKTSFMDGFEAIAVTKSGKVQYYIPYPAGTKFDNEDRIQHLMTDNPDYRTEKGVGAGTPIKQAVSAYGGATLSFSKENESREFIGFVRHPNGLAFRPKPVKNRSFAGQYPESNEEYLKTQKYDVKAAIGQISVSCENEQCGKQSKESKESGE
jgi:hypothetical protein